MPGSVFYNGTCIYISKEDEKLSWADSEEFCKSLPLNASLLIIQNGHKLEFLKNEIIKIKELENSIDHLRFYAGFKYNIDSNFNEFLKYSIF